MCVNVVKSVENDRAVICYGVLCDEAIGVCENKKRGKKVKILQWINKIYKWKCIKLQYLMNLH